MMFERFRAEYASRRDDVEGGAPSLPERLVAVDGYVQFAEEFTGASFAAGLYRVHDERSGAGAQALICDAFPEFAARICPFGYDWLGRQFVVDTGRLVDGQPLVLLLEPGTGEALEIRASFVGFHDEEMIEHPDAALAIEFFNDWSGKHPDTLPLRRDSCIGYQVPLFLGGQDVIENLEVSDLDVYWSICGQLRLGVGKLPPGTSIDEVSEA
jgi:hypothetical protein